MKTALALFVFSMLGVIIYLYYILIRDSYDANKNKPHKTDKDRP